MVLPVSVQSAALSLIQSRMVDVRGRLSNPQLTAVNMNGGGAAFFNSWIALKDVPTEEENDLMVGMKVIRTALDGLDEISTNLKNLRESAYETTRTQDGEVLQNLIEEADSYLADIQAIVEDTDFRGVNLFDGSRSSYGELKIYNNDFLSEVSIKLHSLQIEDLGLDGDNTVDSIDQAINEVLPFYNSLSDSYQQFAGKYFGQQKDVVRENVVRGISNEIDFVSNNSFYRSFQIRDGFTLDVLGEIGIQRGTLSIRV